MKTVGRISLFFLMILIISSCNEATEREWYCKEGDIKLKISVIDSCDVFVINDYDSIYTTKNYGNYYEGYFLCFIEGTDSVYFINNNSEVARIRQKNFKISAKSDNDKTIEDTTRTIQSINKSGIILRGAENGIWFLFVNDKYIGEIPMVNMK